jgi:hypothetical protein
VPSPSPSWLSPFQQCFPSTTFRPVPFAYASEEVVFVHGSVVFVQSVLDAVPSMVPVVASFVHTALVPSRTHEFVGLQSELAGSVVEGQWYFMTHHLESPLPTPTHYPRFIKHILDVADNSMSRFRHAQSTFVLPTMHLPSSCPSTLVHCRSVFNRHCFFFRSLSVKELGRAYDIPSSILQFFGHQPPKAVPWIASPPGKLVHLAAPFD